MPPSRTLVRMNLGGKFIVFDGPDGAGKGTQIRRLEEAITGGGGRCRLARDPGGTTIGDRIRHVLLGYDLSEMDPTCEALLFMASRAQLLAEVIRPALAERQTVICDRFISATCAYQVAAGFPLERVLELGRIAVGASWPDLTIVLDAPPEVGFQRTGRTPQKAAKRRRAGDGDQLNMFADAQLDAMEQRPLDFHRRVRELFLELPRTYPAPVVVIAADRDADAVWADVKKAIEDAFP